MSVCRVCKKEFSNSKSLSNHIRWHDLPEYKVFQAEALRKWSIQIEKIDHPKGINLKDSNGQWKGDDAGLSAIHLYIRRRLEKPLLCQECGKIPPYDLANISGNYLRDLSDWRWLCRKCHMEEDGRINNLKQYCLPK